MTSPTNWLKQAIRRLRKVPRSPQDRYPHFSIGSHTYGYFHIEDYGEGVRIAIGDYCSIAHDVSFLLGGEHDTRLVSTYPFNAKFNSAKGMPGHPRRRGDITVGNDVWIGRGATILSGVSIGDGAVIGARALVVRDVSPYAIVSGVPAVELRKRFDDATISELLELRWWAWPESTVESAIPFLMSPDIRGFVQAARDGVFNLDPPMVLGGSDGECSCGKQGWDCLRFTSAA